MFKSPFVRLLTVILVIVVLIGIIRGFRGGDREERIKVSKNSILQLQLDNVILNGKRFLKTLKKYREDHDVRAMLIVIDSPGGSVGPSQEIYSEILRTREEFKKTVVCVSNGLVASGAYYAAAACDKLVVAPGALVGSVGVIMGFANLQGLYDWAKVSRYSITSGKYKDSGAEYRPMRDDEKQLFQEMIDEVYQQFRSAIASSRKIKDDVLDKYTDGRVFTGAKAVELGFADKVGTFEDAAKMTAEMAGLGSDYEVIEAPKKRRAFWEIRGTDDDDNVNSFSETQDIFSMFKGATSGETAKTLVKEFLRTQWLNRPVLLMPGYF